MRADLALIGAAFRALGGLPRDLDVLEEVAETLRAHADADTLAMFEPVDGDDTAPLARLTPIAEANCSNGFVAIDLLVEMQSPGVNRRALIRRR